MAKNTLGILGVGAFGEFAIRHLAPFFDITLYDAGRDIKHLEDEYRVTLGDLSAIAACKVIMLAVPVQKMEAVVRDMAPLVKPSTLMLDVGSVKVKPTQHMTKYLPDGVDIVGLHPLFGPQSGKNGIEGLNIVVCAIRGDRTECVTAFLEKELKLNVFRATPEEHDKELAYVQGLTHMLAKVVVSLDLPHFRFTTKAYDYMHNMIEIVRYDSDELFKAIERENPFSDEAKKSFFAAARRLEEKLMKD